MKTWQKKRNIKIIYTVKMIKENAKRLDDYHQYKNIEKFIS